VEFDRTAYIFAREFEGLENVGGGASEKHQGEDNHCTVNPLKARRIE